MFRIRFFLLCLLAGLCLPSFLFARSTECRSSLLILGVPAELPPLAYHVGTTGDIRGLLVDLGDLLANRLQRKVIFMEGGPGRLERLLQQGKVDCIMGIPSLRLSPNTEGMVFTPLALNRRIINCPPYGEINSEVDFAGRRILLTHYDMAYGDVVRRRGGTVVMGESVTAALHKLCNGEADAYVTYSGEVALGQAQRNGIGHLKVTGLSLGRIPITMRLPEGREELEAAITTALVALENEGELDFLREKWLGHTMVEKTLWERYRNRIFGGLAAAAVLAVLSMVWIITLRRQVLRTTSALRQSERWFRELFVGSPDMALLLDSEGRIHLANRAARDILELSFGPQTGSTALLDALRQEGKQQLFSLLRGYTLAEGDSRSDFPSRVTLTLHPGTPKARMVEFLPFTAESRGVECPRICCIGRDLTMHKRLEKELIDAERLAIIGKTAACVAHEINNPLGIIMANTGVLLEESEEPAQRRLLEAISRNVERAAATTQRMLKIAMPKETNMVPQNLRELFEETLSFMGSRLKRVEVDLSGLPMDISLVGDRTMLEQLFTNLLLNSLNSIEGEGQLRISAKALGEAPPEVFDRAARQIELIGVLEEQIFSEHWIQVDIADSGRGIEQENLYRLFDPFFTTRGEGFGLGLWVSRSIVELHKGVIFAQSQAGKGATISMVFALGNDYSSPYSSSLS